MPAFLMKHLLLAQFPQGAVAPEVADSVDFMVEQLETLPREALAARLTLATAPGYVEPQRISAQPIRVMIIDVLDQTALAGAAREELFKMYPTARIAHTKRGGNFLYLADADTVNLFLNVRRRVCILAPYRCYSNRPAPPPSLSLSLCLFIWQVAFAGICWYAVFPGQ